MEEPEIPEDVSYEPSIAPGTPDPTIPEDVEVESEEEESPVVEEQGRSRATPTRRQAVFPSNSRNVRQRTESTQLPVSGVNSETAPARIVEPETPSSAPIIPESSGSVGPLPWPMIQDSLDDLPLPIRQHARRDGTTPEQAEGENSGLVVFSGGTTEKKYLIKPMGKGGKFVTFMCARFGDGRPEDLIVEGDNQGQVAGKLLDFNSASPKMKALILEAMRGEWGKFERYSAAVLISGPDLEKLLRQGHAIIP